MSRGGIKSVDVKKASDPLAKLNSYDVKLTFTGNSTQDSDIELLQVGNNWKNKASQYQAIEKKRSSLTLSLGEHRF